MPPAKRQTPDYADLVPTVRDDDRVEAVLADADDAKKLTLELSLPAWQQLKTMAVAKNLSMTDLIEQSLDRMFEAAGQPAIVVSTRPRTSKRKRKAKTE